MRDISIGDAVKSRLEELALEVAVLRDAYIARRLIGSQALVLHRSVDGGN